MDSVKVAIFDLGDTLIHGHRRWILGAQAMLAQLRQMGIRLCVISNTGHLTREVLTNEHLPEGFQWKIFDEPLIILSSEVGLEKPDVQIFKLAIKKAQNGLTPGSANALKVHECLFCGESLLETIAAQQVGMRTIRVHLPPPGSHIGELVTTLSDAGLL